MQLVGRRIAGERGQRGRVSRKAAERNVEWMEQMVARAKGKQYSTHDSHVVTAAPERRKKIGLYLLHFGRLPLPSLSTLSFGSVYRLGAIEIQRKGGC